MRRSIKGLCFALIGQGLSACLDPATSGELVPPTAEQDDNLPQLSFNGSTFHLETFGDADKPVIVFLHGGPGGDYRGLLRLLRDVDGRRLADEYFLVFWDQRGAGLSQRHALGEVSIDRYDADLRWVIEHFSPQRPVTLIGHSWGGMFATNFVSQHPKAVQGLVLLEPGPLTGESYKEIAGELLRLDFGAEGLNDYAWAGRFFSPDDQARADYMMALATLSDAQPAYHNSTDDREHFWRKGAVAQEAILRDGMRDGEPVWDFTTGLERFKVETLFVASSDNTAIGETFQRRQADFYPNAAVKVVAGAGHDFPWTKPEATLRLIFNYLDQLAGGAQ